jgi:SAM-dependent methyltransferase
MTRNTLKPAQVTQYLGKKSSSRIAGARMRSKRGTHSIRQMYSWLQRIRSLRHGVWYGVSERIRWSRGVFVETPAIELCAVDLEQAERIAALRGRYQVQFEQRMNADTSTRNYEYLDLLDRGWRESAVERPAGGELCDIGCASFWYAAALHAFFRPDRMVGVEVEGHRLFRDGHTRIDYAAGYLSHLPHARFVVADYTAFGEPADIITCWFPFLTPTAILAWRLPLSLLAPQRLFARIQHNLRPNGLFFMVNHGLHEWELSSSCCIAADLHLAARWTDPRAPSAHRMSPPVLSWWRRQR